MGNPWGSTMSFALLFTRLFHAAVRFIAMVAAITVVEMGFELVVWGPHHDDGELREQILLALDSFNPFEIGGVYLALMGLKEFNPIGSNAYKTCFLIKGIGGPFQPTPPNVECRTLACKSREATVQSEYSQKLAQNAECVKDATDKWNEVRGYASHNNFFPPLTSAFWTLYLEFRWGTPGTRFITLFQSILGAYLTYWLMAWTLVGANGNLRMRWYLYPVVFVVGSFAVATLTAYPLAILAKWLTNVVPAVYAYISAHIIAKASDSIGNVVLHKVAGKIALLDH
jgi:hypothetical protein